MQVLSLVGGLVDISSRRLACPVCAIPTSQSLEGILTR
jgi:hypothetical protein